MPLRVVTRAQYITGDANMRPVDYNATLLVKATKGLDFNPNHYSQVQIGGRWVRITNANKDRAIDWFAEWAAAQVKALGDGPNVLVPIPSSKSTPTTSADFRTALLARQVATLSPNTTVAPILRFKAARPSAHEEGGSRSASDLYSEMVLTGALPQGRVILVDDVMTGGGHIKAAAWIIEDQKRTIDLAICCGRTTNVQLPDPLAVPPDILDLKRFNGDF